MNAYLQLHVLLAGLLAALVAGLALLRRARPERSIRRLLLTLLAGAALLGLLQPGILPEVGHILSWHLYLGGEFRLASALSAALPVMAALASLTLALKTGGTRSASPGLAAAQRLYWLALGAGLLVLAADEFFLLHEADEDSWKTVYLLAGALAVAPPALMLRVASLRRQVALLLVGLALLGAGGILLDAVLEGVVEDGLRCEGTILQDGCEAFDFYLPFWRMLEEVSELVGFTLVIAALLLLRPRREPGGRASRQQTGNAQLSPSAGRWRCWPLPSGCGCCRPWSSASRPKGCWWNGATATWRCWVTGWTKDPRGPASASTCSFTGRRVARWTCRNCGSRCTFSSGRAWTCPWRSTTTCASVSSRMAKPSSPA